MIEGKPCFHCDTYYGEHTSSCPEAVPEKEPILQFFVYDHLLEHLQLISKPFSDLAEIILHVLPRNPERTVAFRKLLEAKDAAVRAKLFK